MIRDDSCSLDLIFTHSVGWKLLTGLCFPVVLKNVFSEIILISQLLTSMYLASIEYGLHVADFHLLNSQNVYE